MYPTQVCGQDEPPCTSETVLICLEWNSQRFQSFVPSVSSLALRRLPLSLVLPLVLLLVGLPLGLFGCGSGCARVLIVTRFLLVLILILVLVVIIVVPLLVSVLLLLFLFLFLLKVWDKNKRLEIANKWSCTVHSPSSLNIRVCSFGIHGERCYRVNEDNNGHVRFSTPFWSTNPISFPYECPKSITASGHEEDGQMQEINSYSHAVGLSVFPLVKGVIQAYSDFTLSLIKNLINWYRDSSSRHLELVICKTNHLLEVESWFPGIL